MRRLSGVCRPVSTTRAFRGPILASCRAGSLAAKCTRFMRGLTVLLFVPQQAKKRKQSSRSAPDSTRRKVERLLDSDL